MSLNLKALEAEANRDGTMMSDDFLALLRALREARAALAPFAAASGFGFIVAGEVTDQYGLFAASPEKIQNDMAVPLLLVGDLRRARTVLDSVVDGTP